MSDVSDPITIIVSRSALTEIKQLSVSMADRMHELLEKNTEGLLNPTEMAELRMLVRTAEIGQVVSLALQATSAA